MSCNLWSCIYNPALSKPLYYRSQNGAWAPGPGMGTQESEADPSQKQRSSRVGWMLSSRLGQGCGGPHSGQSQAGGNEGQAPLLSPFLGYRTEEPCGGEQTVFSSVERACSSILGIEKRRHPSSVSWASMWEWLPLRA